MIPFVSVLLPSNTEIFPIVYDIQSSEYNNGMMLLTEDGELMVTGVQNGSVFGTNLVSTGEWVKTFENVKLFTYGYATSVLITKDNKVWVTGVDVITSSASSVYTTWTNITSFISSYINIDNIKSIQVSRMGLYMHDKDDVLYFSGINTYGASNGGNNKYSSFNTVSTDVIDYIALDLNTVLLKMIKPCGELVVMVDITCHQRMKVLVYQQLFVCSIQWMEMMLHIICFQTIIKYASKKTLLILDKALVQVV